MKLSSIFKKRRARNPLLTISGFDEERVWSATFARTSSPKTPELVGWQIAPLAGCPTAALKDIYRGFLAFAPQGAHAVVLPPVHARMISGRVLVGREDPMAPVDATELESAIHNALWRFFDRERGAVAQSLDIPEHDTVLLEARMSEVRVGGKPAVDPIGHNGIDIEFDMVATFAARAVREALHAVFGAELYTCGEIGALIGSIAFKNEQEKILLALIGTNRSHVYSHAGGVGRYEREISLGTDIFNTELAAVLGANDAAHELRVRLEAGQLSNSLARFTSQELKKSFTHFEPLVNANSFPNASAIRFVSWHAFPQTLHSLKRPTVFERGFNELLPASLGEDLGFNITGIEKIPPTLLSHLLPLYAAFYFSPHHDKINHIVHRHLRWMHQDNYVA